MEEFFSSFLRRAGMPTSAGLSCLTYSLTDQPPHQVESQSTQMIGYNLSATNPLTNHKTSNQISFPAAFKVIRLTQLAAVAISAPRLHVLLLIICLINNHKQTVSDYE